MSARTGAAAGHVGHFHEAGFYDSDGELAGLVVPFVEEGVAAGEPVLIADPEPGAWRFLARFADTPGVSLVARDGRICTPARAIDTYRQRFVSELREGAGQIRLTGARSEAADAERFAGWDRFESAVNTQWADFPLWSLCLYDTRTTPSEVIDVVERTHPFILTTASGRRPSPRYECRLSATLPVSLDPLESSPPTAELTDPTALEARDVLRSLARAAVPSATLEDLLIGVAEGVTNALRHGSPPTTVRIWAAADRVVVTVHDTGPGPADPLSGLAPGSHDLADGGLGLWLTHLLDIGAALVYGDDGFSLRLRSVTAS
ncbi:MAG: anti-sigma factor RsbA family regulatory protein [Acidimicrobiales bacterium]